MCDLAEFTYMLRYNNDLVCLIYGSTFEFHETGSGIAAIICHCRFTGSVYSPQTELNVCEIRCLHFSSRFELTGAVW